MPRRACARSFFGYALRAIPVGRFRCAFHIFLDGNGINGLEGLAGVCLFLFDPADNSHAYRITYYDGIAAGHAVGLNPGFRERWRAFI